MDLGHAVHCSTTGLGCVLPELTRACRPALCPAIALACSVLRHWAHGRTTWHDDYNGESASASRPGVQNACMLLWRLLWTCASHGYSQDRAKRPCEDLAVGWISWQCFLQALIPLSTLLRPVDSRLSGYLRLRELSSGSSHNWKAFHRRRANACGHQLVLAGHCTSPALPARGRVRRMLQSHLAP